PSEALTHDVLRVRREVLWNNGTVEGIRFVFAQGEKPVETVESGFRDSGKIDVGKAQSNRYGRAGRNLQLVVHRSLRTHRLGGHSILSAVHNVVVNAIFHTGAAILDPIEPFKVSFVFCEEQLG